MSEAKQSINAEQLTYATTKIAIVRALGRSGLLIRHAGGSYAAKPRQHIVRGLLVLACDEKPVLAADSYVLEEGSVPR